MVMMQYSVMANNYWLLVEGIYLHSLLVITVFSERKYFYIYLAIGWGKNRKCYTATHRHSNDAVVITEIQKVVILVFSDRLILVSLVRRVNRILSVQIDQL